MCPDRRITVNTAQKMPPDLIHEEKLQSDGCPVVCGIDEAGRGPLAGPVAVAAVVLPVGYSLEGLDDSKKLSPARREKAYAALMNDPEVESACLFVDVEEIDRINILQATHAGMRRVIAQLPRCPQAALIDGLPVPDYPVRQQALVKGDALSLSIAAASVLAKVSRDRYMREMDALYPAYGFARHKGYGTKIHMEALRHHGPTPIHRRSFAPVAQAALSQGGT